jgi:hypothetical protein
MRQKRRKSNGSAFLPALRLERTATAFYPKYTKICSNFSLNISKVFLSEAR